MEGVVKARLTQIAASAIFLLFATIIARSVASSLAESQTAISAGALFSKLCTIVFYALLVCFTLTRAQPLAQAEGWQPRGIALLGTFLFMVSVVWLSKRDDLGDAAHMISAALVTTGGVLMVAILLRLGKSFSIMAEARELVTAGPYAIVRHPLYAAEALATIGVLIQFLSWPAVAVVIIQFACQIQRMRNEEAILLRTFPVDYARYMARTRRLIPGVW